MFIPRFIKLDFCMNCPKRHIQSNSIQRSHLGQRKNDCIRLLTVLLVISLSGFSVLIYSDSCITVANG